MLLDEVQTVVIKGCGKDGLDSNQLGRLDVFLVVIEELNASEGNLFAGGRKDAGEVRRDEK